MPDLHSRGPLEISWLAGYEAVESFVAVVASCFILPYKLQVKHMRCGPAASLIWNWIEGQINRRKRDTGQEDGRFGETWPASPNLLINTNKAHRCTAELVLAEKPLVSSSTTIGTAIN